MKYNEREIVNNLMKDETFVIGALIALVDSEIKLERKDEVLNKLADQYRKKGKLESSQISLIKNKVKNYSKKLVDIDIECFENKRITKKESEKKRKVSAYNKDIIKIEFPYTNKDYSFVSRNLINRKYSPKDKCWYAAWNRVNLEKLKEANFELDKELENWLSNYKTVEESETEIQGLGKLETQLYDFQKRAVSFIEDRDGNALVADSQGLGKTLESLTYLYKYPNLRPVLIVCPASVKLNWEREIEKFMDIDEQVEILQGKTTYPIDPDSDFVIINYDILYDWVSELRKMKFKVMIIDEAHKVKDPKSKRSKATFQVAKRIERAIALTGTPFLNRPSEIFNAVKLVNPKLFPNKWRFLNRYCGPKHNGFAWEYNGASNTAELNEILNKEIMIRRRKEDVLPELPNKRHIVVPSEITNRSEYERAESDFINYLKEIDPEKAKRAMKSEAFTKLTALKQLALKGKLKNAIEWIDNFLEQNDKLVVFSFHRQTMDELMKKFKDIAVRVDGSTSGNERQRAIDLFQNDENTRLFAGNIQAASEGITLTAASDAMILEPPWSPGVLEQATDRIHRIGQTADSVNIYYHVAEKTVEEKIMNTINKKSEILKQVIDGEEMTEDQNLLSELIDSYSKEDKK